MNSKVFSINGEEIGDIELNDVVFAREVSDGCIYHAIRNELANRRVGTASTKTRAEVKGSGAKPWAQKGTGRARAGHRRSPVWVGGGIVFGPKPRDYSYKLPKKVKRLAMVSILSQKVKEDVLKVVQDFTVETGKTRDLVTILSRLGNNERTVLVIGENDTQVRRAASNIPWLRILSYNQLSAHALFYGKHIILQESAVKNLNEFYG